MMVDNKESVGEDLTDNEGSLLGLVARTEPVTAYQLMKIYERSPQGNFNASSGGIYPLIKRLKQRGLLVVKQVKGDKRGTRQIMCSSLGHEAIRNWVQNIRSAHTLLEDPLRTKIMSFEHLTKTEQLAWVSNVRKQLTDKIADVVEYGASVSVPFQPLVHANAMSSLEWRLRWLDDVEKEIKKQKA